MSPPADEIAPEGETEAPEALVARVQAWIDDDPSPTTADHLQKLVYQVEDGRPTEVAEALEELRELFSGILTFPRSNELREIARDIPADRLLVETDAPYLAPVPFRGKRNEPAFVAHTARVLAEVRGLEPQAIADLTTDNFRRLFPKAA